MINSTSKIFLLLASFNGFIAVCLGAFGSHGLKEKLDDNLMHAWATAVQYHFYHVLALALVAIIIQQVAATRILISSGVLFALGLLFFCGSLYWLALGGPHWLGPVTPFGGLCFIAAWSCLFIGVLRQS